MTLPPGSKLPFFWQTLSLIVDPLKFLESCAKKYGDFFTLYPLGQQSSPTVFFSHPQAIEQIFTTVADKLELGKIVHSIQFFWTPLQQDWGSWSFWGQFVLLRQQIDDIVYAEITARRSLPPGEDILSLLMSVRDERGELLTDEQLRDQLMTLLLLGHETTASALAWSFYWIHLYPSVKERLKQELKDFEIASPAMNFDRSPYLNAVCQEALRIYPIALISQPRVVKETVTINNYQFVPGTILVPCIYLAHRRQQTFAEPNLFQPERFLQHKFSPYEYFPFGGGNRSCIGAALSMLEMKIILSTVLANYDLELVNKKEVKPVRRGITIVPTDGCQMKLVARHKGENKLVQIKV